MGLESFPKTARVRKRAEYLQLQQHARKVHSEHFLMLMSTGKTQPRVGLTVSRRVGEAVVRNRLKRWMREYVRRHRAELPAGDMVIVSKSSASGQDHGAIDRDLARLLARGRDLR